MVIRKLITICTTLMILASSGLFSLVEAQNTIELTLNSHKRINKPARDEVSGIVKDPRFENVYWIHGDSGTKNRIYAINEDGEVLPDIENLGFELKGIQNKDWEDIAIGEDGTIFVADLGNNCNCREDLSIIEISNFSHNEAEIVEMKTYEVYYEMQEGFLNKFLNYTLNTEALFIKDDDFYVLSKRHKGKDTGLFKLSSRDSNKKNKFELVKTVHFDDKVTAADFAHNKLAVLTASSLWIFEQNETPDLFDGNVQRFTFKADQVESVTFMNADMVLIAEEKGNLYKVNIAN